MALQVRMAWLDDISVIVDFNCRLAMETEGKKLDPQVVRLGVASCLQDSSRGPYFLAVEGEEILGQAQITREWSDWRNGWMWWFQGVYVKPDARRRGVFGALYSYVCHCAKQCDNVVSLRLYVDKDNRVAQSVYRELRMEPTNYLIFERDLGCNGK